MPRASNGDGVKGGMSLRNGIWQQGSFLHEHARPLTCQRALTKSTRPVTATVLHSHRNQIVHFESLLKIEMLAGT